MHGPSQHAALHCTALHRIAAVPLGSAVGVKRSACIALQALRHHGTCLPRLRPYAPQGSLRVYDLSQDASNVLCEVQAHQQPVVSLEAPLGATCCPAVLLLAGRHACKHAGVPNGHCPCTMSPWRHHAASSVGWHAQVVAAWNHDATLFATASSKGTVIRVHRLPHAAKAFTFRRCVLAWVHPPGRRGTAPSCTKARAARSRAQPDVLTEPEMHPCAPACKHVGLTASTLCVPVPDT